MRKISKKRILAAAVICIMTLLTLQPAFVNADQGTFKDIKENTMYKNAVLQLAEEGIVKGYADGSFKAEQTMRSDEFIKLLVSAMGKKIEKVSHRREPIYKEVTGAGWANGAIAKAQEWSIIGDNEISDYTAPLNRAQMAKFMVKAMSTLDTYSKKEVKNSKYPQTLVDFNEYAVLLKDIGSIPAEYKDYVLVAYAKGIVNKDAEGNYKADALITRGEACEAVRRMFYGTQEEDLEINRALELPSQQVKHTWTAGQTPFAITYTSIGSFAPTKTVVTITENGDYSYEMYSRKMVNGQPEMALTKKIEGKLTEKQMAELFDFVLNQKHFLILPQDMAPEYTVYDGTTATIEVKYNGQSKSIGGYHPFDNQYFAQILDKLNEFYAAFEKYINPDKDFTLP